MDEVQDIIILNDSFHIKEYYVVYFEGKGFYDKSQLNPVWSFTNDISNAMEYVTLRGAKQRQYNGKLTYPNKSHILKVSNSQKFSVSRCTERLKPTKKTEKKRKETEKLQELFSDVNIPIKLNKET